MSAYAPQTVYAQRTPDPFLPSSQQKLREHVEIGTGPRGQCMILAHNDQTHVYEAHLHFMLHLFFPFLCSGVPSLGVSERYAEKSSQDYRQYSTTDYGD